MTANTDPVVPLPEPAYRATVFVPSADMENKVQYRYWYRQDQMLAMQKAVAERCAQVCDARAENWHDEGGDARSCGTSIRQLFGISE